MEKNIQLWYDITDTPKKKIGSTVFFKLKGRARCVVENITNADLISSAAFDKLLGKLDAAFLPDEFEREFWPLNDLLNFRKTADMEMDNYIIDNEQKLNKTQNAEASIISDRVAAYILLNNADLSDLQIQTVKAALGSDTSYENMKRVLKKLFCGKKKIESQDSKDNCGIFYGASSSKAEVEKSEVYYAGRRENTWSSRSNYRGYSGRAQGRSNFSPRRNNRTENFRDTKRPRSNDFEEYRKKKMNPIGPSGAAMACSFCNSTFHLRRNCPEFTDCLNEVKGTSGNEDDERKNSDGKPKYSWFMCYMTETAVQTQPENKLQALIEECKGYAILDSGCPNTVCGESWIRSYIQSLGPKDSGKVSYEASSETFTFGDGEGWKSTCRYTIPIYTLGEIGEMSTDVVSANIPLLFSIKAMEKAKMTLDFEKARIRIGDKCSIKLKRTSSGHYAMPISL